MSGDIASRYIGGVPYGPGRSVGRYPNAASVGTMPGVVASPGVNLRPVDTSGVVTPASAGVATGGGGAGGAGGNLLASLLLAGLSAAPDIYRVADRALSGETPAVTDAPTQGAPGSFIGPGGVLVPNAALNGFGTDWEQVFEPGSMSVDDAATQRLLDVPLETDVPGQGGALQGNGSGALSWLNNPLGLPPEAMTPDFGTVAGLDVGNLAYLPAAVFSRGTSSFAKPGGELGGQIGSGIGGILGGILGGPWGAAAGTIAGGAIGGQIGPAPTIGRNFSSFGQFDEGGGINWTSAGGDNGGTAADATGFANWFEPALAAEAAAQGLTFNPAMAGQQFRIGGYDNFSRRGQTPGGYFYTPDTYSGSPENYALRPSDDWSQGGYTADQANAFTRNVLADLTARGAYTQAGQTPAEAGYWGASQGAPLGWYGSTGGDYTTLQSGGSDFSHLLADRQGAITGWVNNAPWRAYEGAVAAMPGLPGEGEYGPPPGPTPYWNGQQLAWEQPGTVTLPVQADGGA